jgi:hypothetical protein
MIIVWNVNEYVSVYEVAIRHFYRYCYCAVLTYHLHGRVHLHVVLQRLQLLDEPRREEVRARRPERHAKRILMEIQV